MINPTKIESELRARHLPMNIPMENMVSHIERHIDADVVGDWLYPLTSGFRIDQVTGERVDSGYPAMIISFGNAAFGHSPAAGAAEYQYSSATGMSWMGWHNT